METTKPEPRREDTAAVHGRALFIYFLTLSYVWTGSRRDGLPLHG